jgi:hypothetical protein
MNRFFTVPAQKINRTQYHAEHQADRPTIFAMATALFSSYFYQTTGAGVALHEIVGHGMLGMRLTSSYPKGTGPNYWIAGFDEFHKVKHAKSPAAGAKNFFSWLFTQHSDHGVAGYANRGPNYRPNALSRYLGYHGTEAWISITGSIPGLIVNTTCVSTGMFLRKKYPALGMGLITFGFTNNLIEGMYAWSAASMSHSQLVSQAAHGHDFANFAIQMSHITGFNSTLIAISTAFFWTGFIPLLALGIYLYQRRLIEAQLPVRTPKKMESLLAYATLATMIMGVIVQIMGIFAITTSRYLLPYVTILRFILPFLGIISIANSLYETYQDLQSPDAKTPQLAKLLSCLKLLVTSAMVTLMIVSTFVPGMQLLFLPIAMLGALMSVSLDFAKTKVINNSTNTTRNPAPFLERNKGTPGPSLKYATPSTSPLTTFKKTKEVMTTPLIEEDTYPRLG